MVVEWITPGPNHNALLLFHCVLLVFLCPSGYSHNKEALSLNQDADASI